MGRVNKNVFYTACRSSVQGKDECHGMECVDKGDVLYFG